MGEANHQRTIMCFSPTGDLVGGSVVVAIGIDACLHVRGRPEYIAIAALPVVLGLHQIDETFVWWWLQGHVSSGWGHPAMWVYLVFALVVLPTLVPAMFFFVEPPGLRRWRIVPFAVVGAAVSAVLLEAMLVGHPSVHLGTYHLVYSIGLHHGIAIIGFYIVATCGPLLVSGFRAVVWFGVANLAAVIVLVLLCASGFTSLWCFYAALLSGAIALHLRYAKPQVGRTRPVIRSSL
jgi:hypothetical protein